MFVVVLTDEGQLLTGPRAVGPFDSFDAAQAFSTTLTERWRTEGGPVPDATVVRVEEPEPGVVVGEL